MWGHLFPHESGVATRSNLTTSFFATDFNEVDTNVTFNMQNELKQIDQWDVMVLHYLGLDHIGHTRGYHSPLIPKKLLEYDGYFQELFNGLQRQSSEPCLIVVAGDHGMTNDGNHGGETYEETHTPLIFISTDDHHQYSYPLNNEPLDASRTFLQIDFAPTISSLFQINIPDQSQGRLISSVMERFSINQSEHLCSLFRNSIQIQHIFKQEKNSKQKKNFDEIIQLNQLFARALEYHYNYIQTESKSMNFFEESVETYQQYLNLIQQKYVFNIDSGQYVFGYCIVLLIILSFIFGVLFRFEYLNQNSILFCVKWFEPISNVLFGSIIGRAIALTIIVGNAFGLVSMNFIQREHLYWNFIQLIILIIIIIENYRQISFNDSSLWPIYTIIQYFIFSYRFQTYSLVGNQNLSAQIVYLITSILFVYEMFFQTIFKWLNITTKPNHEKKNIFRTFLKYWTLFASLTMDSLIMPLMACNIIMERFINKTLNHVEFKDHQWKYSRFFRLAIYYSFANGSFYQIGNSNSLSTVNVSSCFIGLNSFQIVPCSLLMINSTYSTYIFWIISFFVHIYEEEFESFYHSIGDKHSKIMHEIYDRLNSTMICFILFRFSIMAMNVMVAIILHEHPFVWSIIMPKMLYEAIFTGLVLLSISFYYVCIFIKLYTATSCSFYNYLSRLSVV
ncbi:hypothetical protein BLOT_013784 [Blomia tropicalis]|nr:hypothetical protein BLOT_013784 [Blomia tropicalis]